MIDEPKSARQIVADIEFENGWEVGELQSDQRNPYFTKVLKLAIQRLKVAGYDLSKAAKALNKGRNTIRKYW